MKTIIHVNQHNIRANNKNPSKLLPVLTTKTYKDNRYGSKVEVLDKEGNFVGVFVYSPHKPLSCGARVWFETQYEVNVVE